MPEKFKRGDGQRWRSQRFYVGREGGLEGLSGCCRKLVLGKIYGNF